MREAKSAKGTRRFLCFSDLAVRSSRPLHLVRYSLGREECANEFRVTGGPNGSHPQILLFWRPWRSFWRPWRPVKDVSVGAEREENRVRQVGRSVRRGAPDRSSPTC